MEQNQTVRKIEEQPFEFLLYINGNIICQRYFNIRDFNEKSLKSISTMKRLHDDCLEIVQDSLKAKTVDYFWEYYNPYKEQLQEEVPTNDIYEKEDVFSFEIRVNKRSVTFSKFTGNVYPPKVRYQVDIKELIPKIITEIRDSLSEDTYSKNWGSAKY